MVVPELSIEASTCSHPNTVSGHVPGMFRRPGGAHRATGIARMKAWTELVKGTFGRSDLRTPDGNLGQT